MPVVFGSRADGSRVLDSLVRPGRVESKAMTRVLMRYYLTYDEAEWPVRRGHIQEDSHRTVIARYRRAGRVHSLPGTVWGLGEALRTCGVPWMRGSVLLYAFGHLEHVVGAYATAGEGLLPYAGWLRYEINNLPELAAWSPLDSVIASDQDRLLRRGDREAVLRLYDEYRLDVIADQEFHEEVGFLAARQVIREAHSDPPSGYTTALDRAWRRWNANRDSRGFSEQLLNALSVANSKRHPVILRLDEVQRHLQEWLSIMSIQARTPIEETMTPRFDDSDLRARFNKSSPAEPLGIKTSLGGMSAKSS
jgi:hypothetical protein